MITSSIHATRMHAQEIKNNISLIRVAINDVERNDFNEQLKRFYKGLDTSGKQNYLSSTEESSFGMKCLSVHGQLNAKECLAIKQRLHCNNSDAFYKSLFVGKVRFAVTNGHTLDDGCVAFTCNSDCLQAGFIRAIQQSNSLNKKAIIYLEKLVIKECLSININEVPQSSSTKIVCSNFVYTQLSDQIVQIHPSDIIEKLSYIQMDTDNFIIIRCPNLIENS